MFLFSGYLTFKLKFQATSEEALISQYETTIDGEHFTLSSRRAQIRFHLDEQHFGHVQRQIFLKCVANIEQVPNMKRQTSELVYIQSDDLQNLRLINSQNMGEFTESFCLKILFVREQKLLNFIIVQIYFDFSIQIT